MAARDRFGGWADPPQSTLQRYIMNACDPQNFEPNLALDLEVADLINAKKGNAPREAAITIVHYINHRNPNVSLLALTLLDICVKNCGYPFHLQISTKEFLNELVRRFPERPPPRPSRVQERILECIEEWRQTICQTSRYKEDLGFIRDMHRLLLYKGYMFPEVRREDAAVLNPSDNLKSAEEMEEEERSAQSAKLQELIRRGGPEDLQEANRLMKVMAGYDTRHKTDYRAKAAEEVAKVQQKAKLLEEMLQGHQEGDKLNEGDVFEELANALQSAHPKIQRMCEEESDDAEAVSKLLEINDSIHRTIERYKLIKKGDLAAANQIPKGTLGTTTGVGKNAANELSLIDFDPEPASEPTASSNGDDLMGSDTEQQPKKTSLEDDLLGLSFQDKSYGQGGGIALGFGANSQVPGPTLLSSTTQQNSAARIPAPVASPQFPQATQSPKPNYDAFQSLTGSQPPSKSVTPTPTIHHQKQASQPSNNHDPFAALISPSPRSSTPSQQPAKQAPASGGSILLDLGQSALEATAPASSTNVDDEWNFTSALPEPTQNTIIIHNTTVKIVFTSQRNPQTNVLEIHAAFSNLTSQLISDVHFQVAIEKSYTLQLQPQSGRILQPNQQDSITQTIILPNVEVGKGNQFKMRWKIAYKLGTEAQGAQGQVPPLGVP